MTTFHLVRHGEKAGGPGDPGLSDDGRNEAERTAHHLAAVPVVAVWASPLRRARETAAIIAARHGVEPKVDDRLRERINWGDDGSDQSWDEFVEMWDRASEERDWQPPYGDSSRAAGRRLESAVLEAAAAHPDGHVVLVAHGGIIGDVLQNRFDLAELDAANATWADMRTCSVTELEVAAGQWRLISLATCDHLEAIDG
jgi:broad specificity phosphatase PhoE